MPPTTSPTVTESKNLGMVAVLAGLIGFFGLWGIGHMYVGKISIVLLIVGLVLPIIAIFTVIPFVLGGFLFGMLVPSPGAGMITLGLVIGIADLSLWIWQTYDAYSLAKRFNEYLQQYRKAPW